MKLPSPAYSGLSALLLLVAALIAYQPVAARADALADIKKAGVLNVGVFEDFPPFASAGPDMRLHGYDIDVATALAAAMGVKLNLVAVTGQNRIPDLEDHKVDILLSVGDSPSGEGDRLHGRLCALLHRGPGTACAEGDRPRRPGRQEHRREPRHAGGYIGYLGRPPTADIRRFDNYNGVITAFLSGQVHLIVVGNDVGAAVLARHPAIEPEEKFELLTSPDHIALNKNEPALKAALNDAIAKMKSDGSLNEISVKWLHKPLNEKDL